MKTALNCLGWLVVILMLKIASIEQVPFSISGPVILGPILLPMTIAALFRKKIASTVQTAQS